MHRLACLRPGREPGAHVDLPNTHAGCLEREAHPLLGLSKRLLGARAVAHVIGDDQLCRPAGEGDFVRRNFDVEDFAGFATMAPDARHRQRLVRLLQVCLEAWDLLGRPDVGQTHREEFFA